jgi:hypothetical protein
LDTSSKLQFTHLRAMIASGRLEKTGLANEIASSKTNPVRKEQAIHRYSRLIMELRMTADELENLIAVTKHAEDAKNSL